MKAVVTRVTEASVTIGGELKGEIKKGFLVASIVRGKRTIIPGGNDVLKLGDTVVIVTDKHPLLELSSIFE